MAEHEAELVFSLQLKTKDVVFQWMILLNTKGCAKSW